MKLDHMACYQLKQSLGEELQKVFYPSTCSLSLCLTSSDHLGYVVCGSIVMPCPEQRTLILKPQKIAAVLIESTGCFIDN